MRNVRSLAEDVAARLAHISGVTAVALGGSWARRRGFADSGIDLAIYYEASNPPSADEIWVAAAELDDHHTPVVVTRPGEWGPWVNGGARLHVGGREFCWYYRELERVECAIEDASAGDINCELDMLNADSVCSHVYLGEIHYCRPLFDPTNRLAALKSRTAHYPPLLKYTLIKRFLAAANSSLAGTEKSASRGDTFHTVSGLYRSVRSLMQVLYALNERYFVTEKAAIRDVSDFLFRPPRFSEVVTTVLGSPGSTNDQLHKSVRRVRGLLRSVQKLCDFYAPGAVQTRGA